jgi:hypothetical protein
MPLRLFLSVEPTMPTLSPRGVPLTESMPFVARDGVVWLAYLEGFIPERPWVMWYRTLLPGRRLRFDSAGESRMVTSIPAGAPFLSEDRLRTLLDNARPIPPAPPSRLSRYSPWRRNPSTTIGEGPYEQLAPRLPPLPPRRRDLALQTRGDLFPAESALEHQPSSTEQQVDHGCLNYWRR